MCSAHDIGLLAKIREWKVRARVYIKCETSINWEI